MSTTFAAWAPPVLVREYSEWEQRHPDAYEQIPAWCVDQLTDDQYDDVCARRQRARDTGAMLGRLLRMSFMQEVWDAIDAQDTGNPHVDRVAAMAFYSTTVRAYWGPMLKTEQMPPQQYEQWRNAVAGKLDELASLVRGTELEFLIKDDLASRGRKDTYLAGRFSEHLDQAKDAVSHRPRVALSKPRDKYARRKYFALYLFDYLCRATFDSNQAKRLVVLTTAAAFDVNDPSTIERQIYRYLQ